MNKLSIFKKLSKLPWRKAFALFYVLYTVAVPLAYVDDVVLAEVGDTTAPSIPVLEWPINGISINDNTPLMQWADSTDDVGVTVYNYNIRYNCSDLTDVSTCTGNYSTSRASSEMQAGTTIDNTFLWRVQAGDAAGNLSAWSDYEQMTIDTVNPGQVTLSSPVDGALINGDIVTSSWNPIVDADYYIYESYHDSALINLRWTQNVNGTSKIANNVSSATLYWRVSAVDAAGNQGPWSDSWELNIDSTAPDAPTIISPTDGDAFNTTPILDDWTDVTDDSGIAKYRIQYEYDDGHTFSGYPYRETTVSQRNHTPAASEEGGVSFRVQAFDNVGNEGAWSEWTHYFYDLTPPSSDFTAPLSDSYYKASNLPVSIEGESIDDGSAVEFVEISVSPAGANIWTLLSTETNDVPRTNLYDWSYDWSPVAEGVYDMKVEATDVAGNVESTDYIRNLTFDRTKPVVAMTSPALDSYHKGDVDVTGTASDSLSDIKKIIVKVVNDDTGVVCKINGHKWNQASYAAGAWDYSIPVDSCDDGYYKIVVRAVDNSRNARRVVTYIHIDTTAPAMPTGLKFGDVDNGVDIMCGGYSNTTHVTEAWDANLEADLAYYEYSSFNAPNGSAGLVERQMSTNEFDSSWWNIPTEGTYGYQVRAVDFAGNTSDWALTGTSGFDDSCQITIDWVAPDVAIDGIKYPNDTVIPTFITNYNTPVVVLSSTSTDIDTIQLEVNGYTYTAVSSGSEWEATITDILSDGTYTMEVTVTDFAGNETIESQELVIDTVAPNAVYTNYNDGIEITDPVVYVNNVNQLSFTAEYTDAVASSGLYWDSFVIFEAQDDGSFRFSANGKQAFCSWRSLPNLVEIPEAAGMSYSLTTARDFADCTSTLPDGEYYMTHQVYDNATRKDIPSINQFRDVLGLHFIIDQEAPTIDPVDFPDTYYEGDIFPDVTVTAHDNTKISEICYSVEGPVSAEYDLFNTTDLFGDMCFTLEESEDNGWGTGTDTEFTWSLNAAIEQQIEGFMYFDTALLHEGEYTFTYQVKDIAGNLSDETTTVVNLENIAPILTFGSNQTIVEGTDAVFTGSFTDPSYIENYGPSYDILNYEGIAADDSDWTAYINYGDESELLYQELLTPGNINFQNHNYKYNGEYTVTAVICESEYIPTEGLHSTRFQEFIPPILETAYPWELGEGQCDIKTATVTVTDLTPTVVITAAPEGTVLTGTEVTLTANGSGGNTDYTYQWGGDCSGTNATATVTPATAGEYTCTVELTDADGDPTTDDYTFTVNAPYVPVAYVPQVQAVEETEEVGEVDGVSDKVADGEVLGEVCDMVNLSGYVYVDENRNENREDDEQALNDVVVILTDKDGKVIEEVTTDENGYWEASVCAAKYSVSIDEDSVDDKYDVKGAKTEVNLDGEDQEVDLDLAVVEAKTLMDYWWVLLIVIAIPTVYYLYTRFKKDEA